MKKCILSAMLIAVLLIALAGCGSQGSSSGGFADIEAKLPGEIESVTVESSSAEFGDVEAQLPGEIESVTVESSSAGFSEIETILPAGNLTAELHIPDYEFSEITWSGVTLSVPEIDYEISYDKIFSPYANTYTVPQLQIEVPQFDDPVIEDVFVSIADNYTVEQQEQLAALPDAQIAQIASVQLNMTSLLLDAFRDAGLTLAIDPLTGAIPIDASPLFDSDEYALKDEGKAALQAVFAVYGSVLSQPEYVGAIDSIIIEGHTDTQGDHAYNQELSEKRAQAVYDYLLSDECGMPGRDSLKDLLATVGRSFDDPVYAADGSVDMAASRRVEIRFTLKLDQ